MAIDVNIPSQVKNYANLAAFPATGTLKTIFIAEDTNKTYRWTGSAYVEISATAASTWGTIGGTLSNQTDLQNALNAKQPTLVSATNIKTINGNTLLGSGDLVVGGSSTIAIGTTAITSGTVGRVLFEGTGNVVQESANLFWDNTNGRLGIGTNAPSAFIHSVGSIAAASLIARGNYFNNTLVATANNDVLIGLDVNSSFTNGAFTRVSNLTARFTGNVLMGQVPSSLVAYTYVPLTLSNNATGALRTQLSLVNGAGGAGAGSAIDFFTYTDAGNGNAGLRIAGVDNGAYSGNFQVLTKEPQATGTLINKFQIFGSTGNVLIQNGGTFTDAGYKLDVNGTARVSGLVTANGYRVTTNGEGLTAASSTVGIVSYGANGAFSGYTFALNNQYGGGNVNRNFFAVGDNFYLSSALSGGTNTINWFGVYPVINNTGGTTISRGIYYNPTLTNTTGTTHFAFHSTSGNIRFENLPTSAAGLPSGTLYNNLGVLMIA